LPANVKDGQLLKFQGNPTVYLVKVNGLYPFDTFSSFEQYRASSSQSVEERAGQAATYTVLSAPASSVVGSGGAPAPGAPTVVLPAGVQDGWTIKFRNNPAVYLVKPNGLHPFATYESFQAYIPAAEILSLPTTPGPTPSVLTNFIYAGSGGVYFLVGGCKQVYPSFEVFQLWNSSGANISTVPDSQTYPDCAASIVQLPAGIVVQGSDSTIFLVNNDLSLSPFITFQAFQARGFGIGQIRRIGATANLYTRGANIE
jgi:hypothetical protein